MVREGRHWLGHAGRARICGGGPLLSYAHILAAFLFLVQISHAGASYVWHRVPRARQLPQAFEDMSDMRSPCPHLRDAIDVVLTRRHARALLSKAQALRIEQDVAA
jgi:hypothetical protein